MTIQNNLFIINAKPNIIAFFSFFGCLYFYFSFLLHGTFILLKICIFLHGFLSVSCLNLIIGACLLAWLSQC